MLFDLSPVECMRVYVRVCAKGDIQCFLDPKHYNVPNVTDFCFLKKVKGFSQNYHVGFFIFLVSAVFVIDRAQYMAALALGHMGRRM